ncbi:hypothetical protein ACJX0J_012248 [Zea mays]
MLIYSYNMPMPTNFFQLLWLFTHIWDQSIICCHKSFWKSLSNMNRNNMLYLFLLQKTLKGFLSSIRAVQFHVCIYLLIKTLGDCRYDTLQASDLSLGKNKDNLRFVFGTILPCLSNLPQYYFASFFRCLTHIFIIFKVLSNVQIFGLLKAYLMKTVDSLEAGVKFRQTSHVT